MERALRTSLEMSAGDMTIFMTRPVAAMLLAVAVVVMVSPAVRLLGRRAGKDQVRRGCTIPGNQAWPGKKKH